MERIILRMKNLQAMNLVKTWTDVQNLIKNEGFPAGRMMGPRTRVWYSDEIDAWLNSRPLHTEAAPPLRGYCRKRHEARLARQEEAA